MVCCAESVWYSVHTVKVQIEQMLFISQLSNQTYFQQRMVTFNAIVAFYGQFFTGITAIVNK